MGSRDSVRLSNYQLAEQLVNQYVSSKNGRMLRRYLANSELENIKEQLLDEYVEALLKLYHNENSLEDGGGVHGKRFLKLDDIADVIGETNKKSCVNHINACLSSGDADATLAVLCDPDSQLPAIINSPGIARFYHEEMQEGRLDLQKNLSHDDIVGAVRLLNAMANICLAARSDSTEVLWNALCYPDACLQDLDHREINVYARRLQHACRGQFIGLLEVQSIIVEVNLSATPEQYVANLNSALRSRNIEETWKIIHLLNQDVQHDQRWKELLVGILFKNQEIKKWKHEETNGYLYLHEISEALRHSDVLIHDARCLEHTLRSLISAIRDGDIERVSEQILTLKINHMDPSKAKDYARTMMALCEKKMQHRAALSAKGYLPYLDDVIDLHFDLNCDTISVCQFHTCCEEEIMIDLKDIQFMIDMDDYQQQITRNYADHNFHDGSREMLPSRLTPENKPLEEITVPCASEGDEVACLNIDERFSRLSLQKNVRIDTHVEGYDQVDPGRNENEEDNERNEMKEMKSTSKSPGEITADRAATKIQAHVRGWLARKHFSNIGVLPNGLPPLERELEAIGKVQAFVRGFLEGRRLSKGKENQPEYENEDEARVEVRREGEGTLPEVAYEDGEMPLEPRLTMDSPEIAVEKEIFRNELLNEHYPEVLDGREIIQHRALLSDSPKAKQDNRGKNGLGVESVSKNKEEDSSDCFRPSEMDEAQNYRLSHDEFGTDTLMIMGSQHQNCSSKWNDREMKPTLAYETVGTLSSESSAEETDSSAHYTLRELNADVKQVQPGYQHCEAASNSMFNLLPRVTEETDAVKRSKCYMDGESETGASDSPTKEVSHSSGNQNFASPTVGHSHQFTMEDLREEMKCRCLKENVTKMVENKQILEKEVEMIDTRIGLLVKNRIALQEAPGNTENIDPEVIMSTPKKNVKNVFAYRSRKPILCGPRCEALDAYEKLFYKLQTNPKYLYRLVSSVSSVVSECLDEKIIFSLFHFGTGTREEYLLVRFFEKALESEVEEHVEDLKDITVRSFPILQIIIHFYKNYCRRQALASLMQTLICTVIEDKCVINTSPLDIYQRLVDKQTSSVSFETALQNQEVWQKLKESIHNLKEYALMFLEAFNQNLDALPYGFRYILKALRQVLERKFAHERPSNVLKAIGHILYDKTLSPIIKTPDLYLNLGVSNLTAVQLVNLNHIATILQYSVGKKGFGNEAPYLHCLNQFIIRCHEKFKLYLERVCDVDDLETHFDWDHLSEATLACKPEIMVNVDDLRSLHIKLKQHQNALIDNVNDPFFSVLGRLDHVPPPAQMLLADAGGIVPGQIYLTLNPQIDVSEKQSRYLIAKQQLSDLLLVYPLWPPEEILNTLTLKIDEEKYVRLLLGAEKTDPPSKSVQQLKDQVVGFLGESGMELEELFRDVVFDITLHRDQRKFEIRKLQKTIRKLEQNIKFSQDQISEYREYLDTCLERQKLTEKRCKKDKSKNLQYSGWQLKQRGILLSLNGFRDKDLHHVNFQFTAGEKAGTFFLQCSTMGTQMDMAELHLQDLLELQYHGKKTMKLFEQAIINVDPLVHLLNKKFFYCSK